MDLRASIFGGTARKKQMLAQTLFGEKGKAQKSRRDHSSPDRTSLKLTVGVHLLLNLGVSHDGGLCAAGTGWKRVSNVDLVIEKKGIGL